MMRINMYCVPIFFLIVRLAFKIMRHNTYINQLPGKLEGPPLARSVCLLPHGQKLELIVRINKYCSDIKYTNEYMYEYIWDD